MLARTSLWDFEPRLNSKDLFNLACTMVFERLTNRSGADLLTFCRGGPRKEDDSKADVMKAMEVYIGVPEDKIVAKSGRLTRYTMLLTSRSRSWRGGGDELA